MADQKVIVGAQLQVDSGNSNANIKEVNKNLKDVKGSMRETEAAAKSTGKEITSAGGSFGKLKDSISSMPGPLGQAGQGVGRLNTAFKALLANPIILIITAIVGALALLYKAFTSTNDGADKMEQVFAGIGATINVIRDRILKVAGAIAKFFSGDFAGALKEGREAVRGIGDEIAAEFNKAADATRRLQEVEDAMRSLGVTRAKLNRDLAEAKEKISDDTASLAERKKAIDQVRIAEGQQTAQELENAKKKLKAIQDKNALSDKSDEALQAEADAQAEIYRLEEKSANDIRSLNKQSRTIERQAAAQAKQERDAAIARQKEERQKLVEFTNKLTQLQQENELALVKDGYEKELKALSNKVAGEKRANELAFKDRRITKDQQAQLDAALDIQFNLQAGELKAKAEKERLEKEEAFQKELAGIERSIRLKGITDTRQAERVQLAIGYEEKLQDAIGKYKDDATRLAAVKAALDEQLKLEQDKIDAKFKLEDDKKKFEKEEAELKAVIDKQNADFEGKRLALDAETALVQAAFDAKLLSETEYNAKVNDLTAKRMQIADLETAHKKAQVSEVASVLGALADLVGKQTIAGKALGIATALINTYQGASEAIKQKSTLPSPFDVIAKVANVAAVIGMGLKTVKSIASVTVPGGGGGSSASVSAPAITAPAAPLAPTQGTTKLDAGSLNNIGNATVRAFVLDSDVEKNQTRNERLNRAARLGG